MNISPPASGSPAKTVRSGRGDSLRGLAVRLFQDERAAGLLHALNPAVPPDKPLDEGTPLRVPDRAAVLEWARKQGITLGLDPSRGSGTRQKRAWKSFQTGPSGKAAAPPPTGPAQILAAWLLPAGGNALGPGLLLRPLLDNPVALQEALSQRLQWLGAERALAVVALAPWSVVAERTAEVAAGLKALAASGALQDAVAGALVEVLSLEALKEARRLFARAQQALSATALDPEGGIKVVAALKDAEPDARSRLLTTLAVPKAVAASAAEAVDRLVPVKAGLTAAATRPAAERQAAVQALRIPRERAAPVAAGLQAPLSPALAETLALQALGLDAAGKAVQEGAGALLAVVQKAGLVIKSGVDGPMALAHLRAARAAVYRARGFSLDPAGFPHDGADPTQILEHALVRRAGRLAAQAGKPPELLRVAWRVVEALGPQLGDVDASALGRGVGCLLARMSPGPVVSSPESVKTLRPGDLLSMGGAAAVRTQEGVEAGRTLVPIAAELAAHGRFSFALSAAPAQARMEYRRRLTANLRAAYAVPPNLPLAPVSADQVRRALLGCLDHLPQLTAVVPDAVARAQKLRPLVQGGPLAEALSRLVGPARYKFRRDEMGAEGKWLCTSAWLVEHARELPAAEAVASAVHALLTDEGGRLLDALERALLQKLG